MQSSAIKVNKLSKRYRIGERQGYKTLRETIAHAAKFFVRKAKKSKITASMRNLEASMIWALLDVSFEVEPGEVVGIIGKNGAGKSTLLKILSKITEPTSGRVELKGRLGSLLEVGTGFHPELTGHENIYLYGSILGMDRYEITRKFDEIVSFADIEDFVNTPVKRYSSGMYMRLAFAVAAHLETEILLVDEVLAVGDGAFQKKCLGKMGEVSKQGRTVLFVSHNMGAVSKLCQKTILLEKGVLECIGPTEEIIQRYLNEQVITDEDELLKGFKVNKDLLIKNSNNYFTFKKFDIINPIPSQAKPKTGMPLIIKLHYETNKQFLSPAFVVSIKSLIGQEVLRLSTRPISGYEIKSLYKKGIVELHLDKLPLVSGRYYIDIGFVRENIEYIIKLDGVIAIEVEPNDIYGSGIMLNQSAGLIVLKHKWLHKPNA